MKSDRESKYGIRALESGRALQSDAFDRRIEQRDDLDQRFTKRSCALKLR